MKPLVLEYVFDCYSKGTQCSTYDAVDGVSWTPRQREVGSLAGESDFGHEQMLDEVIGNCGLQSCSPYVPYHAQLNPEDAERCRNLGRYLRSISNENEASVERRSSVPDGITVVKFEKPDIFAKSTDSTVGFTIVRSGNAALEQTVGWKTRDNTAKAGRHYVGAEGNVSFQQGETQKVIELQLLSGHGDNNINFKIDLLESRLVDFGLPKTQNVNISDYDNLSRSEKSTIRHLIRAGIPSVPHVLNTLAENVTIETFKVALLRLCSNADSFVRELRVAFDLLNFALHYAPRAHLMAFITQYFENGPELKEVDIARKDSDSDMSQDSNASDNDSELD